MLTVLILPVIFIIWFLICDNSLHLEKKSMNLGPLDTDLTNKLKIQYKNKQNDSIEEIYEKTIKRIATTNEAQPFTVDMIILDNSSREILKNKFRNEGFIVENIAFCDYKIDVSFKPDEDVIEKKRNFNGKLIFFAFMTFILMGILFKMVTVRQ